MPPTHPPADPREPAGALSALAGLDPLIGQFDRALRALAGVHSARRPSPAGALPDTVGDAADRRRVAGLMRVNHAGEVAAQALYHGQAAAAGTPELRRNLLAAADEEGDHLAWCEERIRELGGRTSFLNPLWYAGSFAIGRLAGTFGDRTSLGFLAETERQVVEHLDSHLARLPPADARSRAVLTAMRNDEARHGAAAREAGGRTLPSPARALMWATSRLMTRTARWL